MQPVVIDISFSLPKAIRALLEERIRQILREPPKNLFYVKVTKLLHDVISDVPVDFVCSITLCAIGGIPILEEREFLLYRCPIEPGKLSLRYIVRG